MQLLKKLGLGLLTLVILLVLISFLLPRQVHIERSMVMNAHPDVIFQQINTLRNWEDWSPWHKKDPQMQLIYTGPASGKGAVYTWKSDNDEVGNGKMEIVSSTPYTGLVFEMIFAEEHKALGIYTLSPNAAGTKVTWAMDSDMGYNPVGRYMALMMDKWVGADFEEGLQNIKAIVEPAKSTPEASLVVLN